MKFSTLILFVSAGFALLVAAAEQSVLANAKAQLFEQIDLANQQLYDKAGKLRNDAFDSWSDSQLKIWADSHGLKVPQPTKKDEVKAFYHRHLYLLQQDIDEFLSEASRKASPYLGKVGEAKAGAANIADSFFDLWPVERLSAFLEAHSVKLPTPPTKEKLVELAKQSKKTIVHAYDSFEFESWSAADLKKWLGERGFKLEDDKEELVKQAKKALSKPLDQWSDLDLKSYLSKLGVETEPDSTRAELLALSKSNYNLFKYGQFTENSYKAQALYYLAVTKHKTWAWTVSVGSHVRHFFSHLYKTVSGMFVSKNEL